MSNENDVLLVQSGQAILSLRDSDFDSYSAYGEVIDNSIDAGATEIKIFTKSNNSTYPKFEEIAFVDNGKGMDTDILHRCLQLGYSSRFNDRSGIGRFGVGMILGAVHEAKRVEVYSRVNPKNEWQYTYVDIDEMTGSNPKLKSIPRPVAKEIPEEYKSKMTYDKGTLVIWKKYDRAPDTADKMLKEMEFWIGRTFRYFIWDGVKIFINNSLVKAWDPLFLKPETTKFPDDPKAQEWTFPSFSWAIPDDIKSNKDQSEIKIRAALLPKEFRAYQGVGNNADHKERYIHENEGVSIIRNKREVFFGHIPYWKPAIKEIDRWLGIEILFDAELDRAFTVKHIKRGAVPEKELKKELMERLGKPIKEAQKIVQADWRKPPSPGTTGSGKGTGGGGPVQPVIPPNQGGDTISRDEIRNIVSKELENNQMTLLWERIGTHPQMFEYRIVQGKIAVVFNLDHPMIRYLSDLSREFDSENEELTDEAIKHQNLFYITQYMLISYAITESKFESVEELGNPAEHFSDFRLDWGKRVRDIANKWNKLQGIIKDDKTESGE